MTDKLKSWIYPDGSGIRVREKINTSGQDAFGISYAVTIPTKLTGGVRKRKQFTTKEMAETWAKDQYRGSKKQGESYFDATTAERNDFADMVPKLREAGISLRDAVEFALPRLRPTGGDRTFNEVIEELRQEKKGMLEDGSMRENSEKAFRLRSKKIEDAFGASLVRDLTLDEVKDWVNSLDLAPRTKKNELNCLAEVIIHSVARKYVAENILDGLTKKDRAVLHGRDEEKEPEILSPNEASRLINAALEHPELDLLAGVALGLFCGIRTEEIKKLDWEAVRLDEGFVTISKDVAKKRSIRNVTLSENAKHWLSLCENRNGKITRSNFFCDFSRRFKKLVGYAKFTELVATEDGEKEVVVWKKNAMRHSFGSYHFARHGDSIKTSNELGHKQGDGVLFAHYRALATKKQAEAYFNILPSSQSSKVVQYTAV